VRKKHPKIKKNDKVIVRVGREVDKIGTVLKVDSEKGRVIIEKINMIKRHAKASPQTGQGGIIEKEGPLNISNVMIVCDKCTEPTRIGNVYSKMVQRFVYARNDGEPMDR